MSALGGYGLTGLSATVGLYLDRAQTRLRSDTAQLSSGLRIASAADDPSGLAIAAGLQSQVAGYDQASSNVQDANNALTVADGALQTVSDILQRMKSLAVQANDDLMTTDDRSDLQSEIDQLRHEIDAISQDTSFNGLSLLNGIDTYGDGMVTVADGTFSSPAEGGGATSYAYAPSGSGWNFSAQNASGGAGITAYSATNDLTKYNYPTVQSPPSNAAQVAFIQGQGSFSQALTSFAPFDSYVITFNASQRAYEYPQGNNGLESFDVLVNGKSIGSYTPAAATPSEPTWTSITSAAFAGATGPQTISFEGTTAGTNMVLIDDVNVTISQVRTPSDIGNSVSFQSGAGEGDVLRYQLPISSTMYLGVSSMSLLSSASAAVAETDIDTALNTVGTARAGLGATMVQLQEQGADDNTSFVNLTASEAAIRDTNISAAAVDDTAAQILVSVGTSLMANVKTLAAAVEKLFQ